MRANQRAFAVVLVVLMAGTSAAWQDAIKTGDAEICSEIAHLTPMERAQ